MKENSKENIYCSLDIETSDFDPANGEILEVGMVFFNLDNGKINVLKEWESTFKPAKEVSPRILALTGITEEELSESKPFREYFDEVQDLVKGAIIVGHNISFDIKFMEGFGVEFSGKKVDTLDISQMFLPTNTSYNLESLMSLLNVDHKSAHRALADAKASLVVLERLLMLYSSFPQELKTQIKDVFNHEAGLEIRKLLQNELAPGGIDDNFKPFPVMSSKEVEKALGLNKKIITFPLGFDYYNYVFGALSKGRSKVLLVVPNKKILYQLWKQGLVYPVFDNQDVFNEEAFEVNFSREDMSFEERCFYVKVLIWKNLNWQNSSLIDLNLSLGSQFKSMINHSSEEKSAWNCDIKEKVVAVDYVDFINLDLSVYSNRKAILLDLNNFEQALTYVTGKKVSWNDFSYNIKQIFDFATRAKKEDLIKVSQDALVDIDLFFGLASMNWKKIEAAAPNILVNENMHSNESYQLIFKAAMSFCEKMKTHNQVLSSSKISEYIERLESFFAESAENVRWVEIFENRLTFFTSPLNLENFSSDKLKPFKKIIFTASLGSDNLIKYFINRLGLSDFETQSIGQQELRRKIDVHIVPEKNTPDKMLELVMSLEYPSALVLGNATSLRDFYELNFKILQNRYKVCAQNYSGGTNKLLENFSIQENSLFIGTDHFVLRQVGRKLKVKELVIARIPFEQFTHPLFAAQAQKYENQFIDFNIPRALYNFHSLIRFFYNDDLQKIYILDPKIKKDYGKYFLDYLKSLPFVEIK